MQASGRAAASSLRGRGARRPVRGGDRSRRSTRGCWRSTRASPPGCPASSRRFRPTARSSSTTTRPRRISARSATPSSPYAATCPRSPREGRLWRIPVVYGGEFGIDLESVAAHHGITTGELIRRHSAPAYRVYMMGFLPGFAYLGGLDPSLAISRRENPRLKTPAGTISIGGIQALVASLEAPSGWHLLGRTPVRNFMAERDPGLHPRGRRPGEVRADPRRGVAAPRRRRGRRRARRRGRSGDGSRREGLRADDIDPGRRPLRLAALRRRRARAPWTGSRSRPPTRSSATPRARPRSSSC